MNRGEIWTASAGSGYAGKPRPVVIVQDDRFQQTASVTVCAFTTDPTEAPLLRLPIEPSDANGLDRPSRIMIDKITTVPRSKLDQRLGSLSSEQVLEVERALVVFLGIAD